MKLLRPFLALALLSMSVLAGAAKAAETRGYIPSPEEWQEHAAVLEKYWLNPTAFGNPLGKFPTWRCNDGSQITPESSVALLIVNDLILFYIFFSKSIKRFYNKQ